MSYLLHRWGHKYLKILIIQLLIGLLILMPKKMCCLRILIDAQCFLIFISFHKEIKAKHF
ncbi:hypothetical protein XSR1_470002 [Xenorhabdus szentirmaii DSM 16338]|uniref:Uncharacterized protein n=1 Tax=Xenorhabdus szentirmaii DSM 16338 TaxID=1427518 RepID=W1J3P6_9GAMM|nr:hypothetical protein XSR1_470002 [Xenorhabdus szentirmaii DSM 16338]